MASIPVYLKPQMKDLAAFVVCDFLNPVHERRYQLQDGKGAITNERVTSGMLALYYTLTTVVTTVRRIIPSPLWSLQ